MKRLSISYCWQITNVGFESIIKINNLKSLNFTGCTVNDPIFDILLNIAPKLERIKLGDYYSSSFSSTELKISKIVEFIESCTNLKSLNLENHAGRAGGPFTVNYSAPIEELFLPSKNISLNDVTLLLSKHGVHLKTLSWEKPLSDSTSFISAVVSNCPNLEYLCYRGEFRPTLDKLTRLKILDLEPVVDTTVHKSIRFQIKPNSIIWTL